MQPKHLLGGIAFAALAGLATASSATTINVGAEGFYDHISDSGSSASGSGAYGSITVNYLHDWGGFFAALDLRGTYGEDSFDSGPDEDNFQFEERARIGYSWGAFSPYVGFGSQQTIPQDSHGQDTTSIYYIPVGASYFSQFSNGWSLVPTAEVDPIIAGDNSAGGWGARGSLMLGIHKGTGTWQVGPFVRYWNVKFDEFDTTEKDTQVGFTIRYMW